MKEPQTMSEAMLRGFDDQTIMNMAEVASLEFSDDIAIPVIADLMAELVRRRQYEPFIVTRLDEGDGRPLKMWRGTYDATQEPEG